MAISQRLVSALLRVLPEVTQRRMVASRKVDGGGEEGGWWWSCDFIPVVEVLEEVNFFGSLERRLCLLEHLLDLRASIDESDGSGRDYGLVAKNFGVEVAQGMVLSHGLLLWIELLLYSAGPNLYSARRRIGSAQPTVRATQLYRAVQFTPLGLIEPF
ncbi:hypothetical protein U1Q18_015170 [Sarracenia purpurea var. burkii]